VNWTVGFGSIGNFSGVGAVEENQRILYNTPVNTTEVVWQAVNDAASDADGGWGYNNIPIDSTKTYRFSVWIKKTGSSDGSTFL